MSVRNNATVILQKQASNDETYGKSCLTVLENYDYQKRKISSNSTITSDDESIESITKTGCISYESKDIFLIQTPIIPNEVPKRAKKLSVIEDHSQVMQLFNKSMKCVKVKNQEIVLRSKTITFWNLVEESLAPLTESIESIKELEKAIKRYNFQLRKYSFDILHKLSSDEKKIIPRVIKLALSLPEVVPNVIPLLCQKQNKTLFLSQHQISCLLANAFLCTFHQKNTLCPDINFNNLFKKSEQKSDSNIKLEKLKCIMNYFKRVLTDKPKGVISFERRFLTINQMPKWNKSVKSLSKLNIYDKGSIETEGKDMIQIDFANKLIGGGVLGKGCAEEEIRFCINTELIVSRLFTQQLLDEEVLVIKGSEQYNTFDGFGHSFEWDQDFKDMTKTDDLRRKSTTIVAMDALRFDSNKTLIQYDRKNLNRELNKAFCGFMNKTGDKCPVATGNWGCGTHNGDKVLKALIQLMAASECEIDLNYFTYNDNSLKKELDKFYQFINDNHFQVRHLYRALILYDSQVIKSSKSYKKDLTEFITKSLESILRL